MGILERLGFVRARPTELSLGGKLVRIGPGETLRSIARREYGDEAARERILAVTANPWLQTALWMLLEEDEGVAVEAVASGEEARERIARWQPRLVFVDVSCWPVPNRGRMASAIHDMCGGTVPVVIIDRAEWSGDRLRRAGGSGFLRQPFTAEELGASVGNALGIAQAAAHEEVTRSEPKRVRFARTRSLSSGEAMRHSRDPRQLRAARGRSPLVQLTDHGPEPGRQTVTALAADGLGVDNASVGELDENAG